MPEVTPIQCGLLEGKRSTDRLCPEAFLALAERSVAECSARGMMWATVVSARRAVAAGTPSQSLTCWRAPSPFI
jgi:hypothetical protein